jgi:Gpi18-like mannosyltransferase
MVIFISIHASYVLYSRTALLGKINNKEIIPIFTASLLAIVFLFNTPTLSKDVYRYLWDGMLVQENINPYLIVPNDTALSEFHESTLYKSLDWKDQFTLYPPLAQYIFSINHRVYESIGIVASKLIYVLPVVVLFWMLKDKLRRNLWILLILNPLLLFEVFNGSHIEGYVILFLTGALLVYEKKKYTFSALLLAFATLTRVFPIIFLPLFIFDLFKKKSVKIALSYLSVFSVSSILLSLQFLGSGFAHIKRLWDWTEFMTFNASFFRYFYNFYELFMENGHQLAQLTSLLVFMVGYLFFLRKGVTLRNIIGLGIFYLILSPIVFPWYTLFITPFVFLQVQRTKNYTMLFSLFIFQVLISATYLNSLNILPSGTKNIIFDLLIDMEYIILGILIYLNLKGYYDQRPKIFPK